MGRKTRGTASWEAGTAVATRSCQSTSLRCRHSQFHRMPVELISRPLKSRHGMGTGCLEVPLAITTPPASAAEAPSRPHCAYSADPATNPVGCRGIHVPGHTSCLAHLADADCDAYTARLISLRPSARAR